MSSRAAPRRAASQNFISRVDGQLFFHFIFRHFSYEEKEAFSKHYPTLFAYVLYFDITIFSDYICVISTVLYI